MFESNNDVLAGTQTLVNQAAPTVAYYLRGAVDQIDRVFGEGHAKNHPELVGAYVLACAADFQAAMTKLAGQDIRDAINAILDLDA